MPGSQRCQAPRGAGSGSGWTLEQRAVLSAPSEPLAFAPCSGLGWPYPVPAAQQAGGREREREGAQQPLAPGPRGCSGQVAAFGRAPKWLKSWEGDNCAGIGRNWHLPAHDLPNSGWQVLGLLMSFPKAWIWTLPSPLSSEPRLPITAAAGCTAPLHPPQGLGWKQSATGQFCYRSPPLISPLHLLPASEMLEQIVGAGGPRARGWEAGPVSTATQSP